MISFRIGSPNNKNTSVLVPGLSRQAASVRLAQGPWGVGLCVRFFRLPNLFIGRSAGKIIDVNGRKRRSEWAELTQVCPRCLSGQKNIEFRYPGLRHGMFLVRKCQGFCKKRAGNLQKPHKNNKEHSEMLSRVPRSGSLFRSRCRREFVRIVRKLARNLRGIGGNWL